MSRSTTSRLGLALVFPAAMILLAGCGGDEERTHRDIDAGMEISFPEGWIVKPGVMGPQSPFVAYAPADATKNVRPFINVLAQRLKNPTQTVEQFAAVEMGRLRTDVESRRADMEKRQLENPQTPPPRIPNMETIDQETVQLGDQQAVRAEYHVANVDPNFRTIIYFFVANERGYSIICNVDEADVEKFRPLFEQTAESFKPIQPGDEE